MYKNETVFFYEKIDYWILDSVRSGITNFDDLLTSLPGVYPTIVKDSIERLVSRGILSESLIDMPRYDNLKKIPISSKFVSHIPHPLDFDWRFSHSTVSKLLRYLNSLTKERDRIALLGTPSFLGAGLAKFRRNLLW
ncbi:MAG: hypothetical protein KGI27_04660 [Thaumarchaeota archaeon]|nr:hypothetical protein [Nitrososphaerota archaeon]